MFLVLVTVTKEFIECMTSVFTVYVPPTPKVEPTAHAALAAGSFELWNAARVGSYAWVLAQIIFETMILVMLLYASFRQVGFFLHFSLKCTKKGAVSAFSIENR